MPLECRKQLLDGSMTALFGRKQRLFVSFTEAVGNDPEEDVSRLLGLLWWLAYDSGLDVRELRNFPANNPEERRERLLNLSLLFEIAIASGKDNEVFIEAESSIWRTTSEPMRAFVSNWIGYHREWSKAVFELYDSRNSWKPNTTAKIGGIGIATKEKFPKLRVILDHDEKLIHFVELGEANKKVSFLPNFVNVADMPIIIDSRSTMI
ncbi:hypothetical protein Desac_0082 [Desulfobacca acetoxidans DSM 11109]|uniref:Uncharacterized protein n=1 Tax=Desulfobacca acetoxidans (strain ATCC 700848 / DSM 11109 / ASRB2) TaxID=880072 RepID=F2NJ22_DESAR|nr:hypothetical protein Desac_0082 [Desulfobacca acetoxidans DSM 11109]